MSKTDEYIKQCENLAYYCRSLESHGRRFLAMPDAQVLPDLIAHIQAIETMFMCSLGSADDVVSVLLKDVEGE